MKTISRALFLLIFYIVSPAHASTCIFPTAEMMTLPYFGKYQYKNKIVFILGEDHRQNDKNLKILTNVYSASLNCQIGYFMEGYVVNDPRSLFLYFGQKDHRETLYLSKIILPMEDFKSLYLEKLLRIYLYTNQSLIGNAPEGVPQATLGAAEAFASLLIFSSKSQLSYDQLASNLDRFDLLGELQDRFDLLNKIYDMGYLQAFDSDDGFKKMYTRYGNILNHPYLIASDSFPTKIAIMISDKDRNYIYRLKQFAAEQISAMILANKNNLNRQNDLKEFLVNPSQILHEQVLVNWRNEDMALNIQKFGITNSLNYLFIRVGAAHIRGLVQELNKAENKITLIEEKIDPEYKNDIDPQH